jgi:putative flippase GtrA
MLTGGLVALVYIGTTSFLAEVIGVAFQVALVIGFTVGLATHFALQRLFVWSHADAFALPLGHQLVRYLLLAAAQYGTTAASTAILPRALGAPTEVVYITTVTIVAAANFLIFRSFVFHPQVEPPTW